MTNYSDRKLKSVCCRIYAHTLSLLIDTVDASTPLDLYLNWEIELLKDLGYALDLSKCSGCQKTEKLCYLSPRTGRAVCADCGAPYADKLYKLPVSLNVTKRFLDNVCASLGVEIPMARKIF